MQAPDVLRFGHEMLERTIHRYGPSDWSRVALGTWTAKDLLGHLGAFEARAADVLATFAGGPVLTDLMDADPSSFNDDQAAIRADWPVAKVLDEYRSSYARVATYAARISAERWREIGTIPWYGDAYSLDDWAVYTIYGHKREHDPQLSAALEASI